MGIIGAIIASICYLALIGYGVYTIYTFVKKLFSSNQNTKNLISVPTQANAVKAINVADAKSVQRNTAIRESSSEITDEHIQAIKKSIGSLEELYSEIKNHHNPVEFDTSSKFKNQLSNAKQEIRDLILSLYTPADIDEHEQRFYEIFRNGFCVKKVNKFFFGRINIEKRTFSALKTCFKIDKKILDIGNNAANFEKEEISKNNSGQSD